MAFGNTLVVPQSQIKNVFSRSDSELSAIEAQREVIQAKYTISDKDIYMNEFHLEIIQRQLTKNIPLLTKDIAEELALAFRRYWGVASGWVEIRLLESVLKIVAQAVNRSFLGLPICMPFNLLYSSMAKLLMSVGRDERFLQHSIKYSDIVFGGGIVISILPVFLRRFIGPLVGLGAKKHLAACKDLCRPVVEERLWKIEQRRKGKDPLWEAPVSVVKFSPR